VRTVTYTVHHLDVGGWITTVREEGDQPRPLAVSRHTSREEEPRVAAEMAEKIFSDMHFRERQRREGSLLRRKRGSDEVPPRLCEAFAGDQLGRVPPGQAVSFTERFIREWFGEHASRSAKGPNKRRNRRHSTHLTKVQPN